jgi:hypothetical protein
VNEQVHAARIVREHTHTNAESERINCLCTTHVRASAVSSLQVDQLGHRGFELFGDRPLRRALCAEVSTCLFSDSLSEHTMLQDLQQLLQFFEVLLSCMASREVVRAWVREPERQRRRHNIFMLHQSKYFLTHTHTYTFPVSHTHTPTHTVPSKNLLSASFSCNVLR